MPLSSIARANYVISAALGSLNAAVEIDVWDYFGCGFTLAPGTLVGTLVAELSFDGGDTWIPTRLVDPMSDEVQLSLAVSGASLSRIVRLRGGASKVRVRVSTYTSGTSVGTLVLTAFSSNIEPPSPVSRTVVNQGGAGTLVLAAASPGNKHKVMAFWLGMTNNGSLQFTDGAGILMGNISQQNNSPSIVLPSGSVPLVETATNSPLNLVSTGGAARGVVVYVTEP